MPAPMLAPTPAPTPALSVLDLAPVPQGSTPGDALRNARDLAQHTERLGYRRYWLAEHHNMVGIASAATAVALAHVAEGTSQIRAGTNRFDTLMPVSPAVLVDQVLPIDGQRCDQA